MTEAAARRSPEPRPLPPTPIAPEAVAVRPDRMGRREQRALFYKHLSDQVLSAAGVEVEPLPVGVPRVRARGIRQRIHQRQATELIHQADIALDDAETYASWRKSIDEGKKPTGHLEPRGKYNRAVMTEEEVESAKRILESRYNKGEISKTELKDAQGHLHVSRASEGFHYRELTHEERLAPTPVRPEEESAQIQLQRIQKKGRKLAQKGVPGAEREQLVDWSVKLDLDSAMDFRAKLDRLARRDVLAHTRKLNTDVDQAVADHGALIHHADAVENAIKVAEAAKKAIGSGRSSKGKAAKLAEADAVISALEEQRDKVTVATRKAEAAIPAAEAARDAFGEDINQRRFFYQAKERHLQARVAAYLGLDQETYDRMISPQRKAELRDLLINKTWDELDAMKAGGEVASAKKETRQAKREARRERRIEAARRSGTADIPETTVGLRGRDAGYRPGVAIWHGPAGDQPIEVIAYLGRVRNRDYVRIEGSTSGVPLDEIEY